jgi:hypothetical protein
MLRSIKMLLRGGYILAASVLQCGEYGDVVEGGVEGEFSHWIPSAKMKMKR